MYCIFKVKGRNKTALLVLAILLIAAVFISILGLKKTLTLRRRRKICIRIW